MSATEITSYFRLLEDQGWTYEERQAADGSRWWTARSNPPHAPCELRAACSPAHVVLEVPLAAKPLAECGPALWRYLLRLNGALKLAKFTLGPGDSIKLAAELPAAACTFAGFRDALSALRTYHAHFRREIEVLAANPPLALAWLALAPRAEELPIHVLSRVREV